MAAGGKEERKKAACAVTVSFRVALGNSPSIYCASDATVKVDSLVSVCEKGTECVCVSSLFTGINRGARPYSNNCLIGG